MKKKRWRFVKSALKIPLLSTCERLLIIAGHVSRQEDKSDESDEEDEAMEEEDDEEENDDDDDEEDEEEEEEEMEGQQVDQNFRLELMKVLQKQNALVSFQAF